MLESRSFMRENLTIMIDPFSDFLSLMGARSVISGGLVAGGAWAINFPRANTVKFWGVARGSCWILFEGDKDPITCDAHSSSWFSDRTGA